MPLRISFQKNDSLLKQSVKFFYALMPSTRPKKIVDTTGKARAGMVTCVELITVFSNKAELNERHAALYCSSGPWTSIIIMDVIYKSMSRPLMLVDVYLTRSSQLLLLANGRQNA